MEELRYPIGRVIFKKTLSAAERAELIRQIADVPAKVREAVKGLSGEQLDTRYRDGGWTVRQVVHHLVDSHVNAHIRCRLALTEDKPTIKPYDEAAWAELSDAKTAPISLSLSILDGLHERWAMLLRSLEDADFSRKLIHPEHGEIDLDWILQMYGWHGRHHTAHIMGLRQRKNW